MNPALKPLMIISFLLFICQKCTLILKFYLVLLRILWVLIVFVNPHASTCVELFWETVISCCQHQSSALSTNV